MVRVWKPSWLWQRSLRQVTEMQRSSVRRTSVALHQSDPWCKLKRTGQTAAFPHWKGSAALLFLHCEACQGRGGKTDEKFFPREEMQRRRKTPLWKGLGYKVWTWTRQSVSGGSLNLCMFNVVAWSLLGAVVSLASKCGAQTPLQDEMWKSLQCVDVSDKRK